MLGPHRVSAAGACVDVRRIGGDLAGAADGRAATAGAVGGGRWPERG